MGNNLFWVDPRFNSEITYSKLFSLFRKNDLKFYPFCKKQNPQELFFQLVLSLLIDRPIVLLDGDFSSGEIRDLIGDEKKIQIFENIPTIEFDENIDFSELFSKNKNWKVTIFTSGTTGRPKSVSHSFKTLTRAVKKNDLNKSSIWGFAYNPSHMAGLQVFFQAFLNQNPMINIFGQSGSDTLKLVRKYNITHISATPTFFRMLVSSTQQFDSVLRITSGGEKFDPTLMKRVNKLFPKAKILNVYASTEAGTLFAGDGDVFSIRKENQESIKIENGELLVHKRLLAPSAELNMNQEWYKTGDLVKVIQSNPLKFKFISRKSEMINVGGYKVNPHEVESVVCHFEGVNAAHVYGKPNSVLGNILYCELEINQDSSFSEKALRTFLQAHLQGFKIPRIFEVVDGIEKTRTGKVKRT